MKKPIAITLIVAAGAAAAWAGDLVPSPERPGGSFDDPVSRPHDLSGRSIKCPRVRAMHLTDPNEEGGSAYLLDRDPWLGYQRGRELFLREFSKADGAFGNSGAMAGQVLEDEATKFATRDHVASCALCHNSPFRDGGAGATFFKNGGTGRNTMHLFGVGLIEMLGWEIRLELLAKGDKDRKGWIRTADAKDVSALIETGAGATVDFGRFDDPCGCGKPHLNKVCFIYYVDEHGKRVPWARYLTDPGVAGYAFEVQLLGWGHRKGSVASTIRAFSANAFDLHTGLQAYDPTLNEEPEQDGLALVSQCGAPQFFTGRTRDRGLVKDERGVSRDDPDRDGVFEEITEGDLDLVELYQLNHPVPYERPNPEGSQIFDRIGCTRCHTPNWRLAPANPGADDRYMRFLGERRFFELELSERSGRLEGNLRKTTKGAGVLVRGVYSDFLHHDLGPGFHQMQFDGSLIKSFRTAPLWGVGSTAPYGHDGASLDLDSVIRRHAGEADKEARAYEALSRADRAQVLEFLRGLVLYSCDDLPCDVDGDGEISEHFMVAGRDTGIERFNPEWLFKVPGKIEGEVTNPDGIKVRSFALQNVEEAYGCHLKWLEDKDHDGFPDARFQKK